MKISGTLLAMLVLSGVALAQEELTDADKQLIQAIQDAGGQALPLAKNDARLSVAFHLSDKEITDETLAVVKDAANVYSLNLRGTKITDAGLAQLTGLKGLAKLHLEKTGRHGRWIGTPVGASGSGIPECVRNQSHRRRFSASQ